jgi:uncharacterized protein
VLHLHLCQYEKDWPNKGGYMASFNSLALHIYSLFLEMAPWLLLGFFIAGFLKALLPDKLIVKHLSEPGQKSIIKAALLGVPLPLCSCGVIPVSSHLYNQKAGKGATISFLTSTPSTGIDSILATNALLGPVFAIIRPIYALVTGWLAGTLTDVTTPSPTSAPSHTPHHSNHSAGSIASTMPTTPSRSAKQVIAQILHYGLIFLVRDTRKWLLIGIVLGGVISWAIPTDLGAQYLGNPWISYGLMLVIGIPMYVCATGSIPIAASLVLKGLTPGAALIFLTVGPATNTATLSFISAKLGTKTLLIYLSVISATSLLFALVIDIWAADYMRQFFTEPHLHEVRSFWVYLSSGIFAALLIYSFLPSFTKSTHSAAANPHSIELHIPAITCQGCASTVKSTALTIQGVQDAQVNVNAKTATIFGDFSQSALKKALTEKGYPAKEG